MSAMTPIKAAEIMEAVIARGDLSDLSPEERAKYYVRVCQSLGLNPMTRPFEYIVLNGKLTLYARKDATDQLRTLYKISVTDIRRDTVADLCIVIAKVTNARGRTDAATGAVYIANLKGEALANAIMKAETKAKRRATLSVCGLGFLDETEIEDIANRDKAPARDSRPPKPPSAETVRNKTDLGLVENGRDDGTTVTWDDPAPIAEPPQQKTEAIDDSWVQAFVNQ